MRNCKLVVSESTPAGSIVLPVVSSSENIPDGQLINIGGISVSGTFALQASADANSRILAISELFYPIKDLTEISFPNASFLAAENALASATELEVFPRFVPALVPIGSIGSYQQIIGGTVVECAWTPANSPALQLAEPLPVNVSIGTEIWYEKLDIIAPFYLVIPLEVELEFGAIVESLWYAVGSTGEYPVSFELEIGYLPIEFSIAQIPKVILEVGAEVTSIAKPFLWAELDIDNLVEISIIDYVLLQ